MKAWLVFLPVVITLPTAVGAQTASQAPTAAEDARAAELVCIFGGVCGDLAIEESEREKQTIEGVDSRGIPSLGALRAAQKDGQVRPEAGQANRVMPPKRSRQIRRALPTATPAGLQRIDQAAADIPATLALRAPLFITFALNSSTLSSESMSEVRSFARAIKELSSSGQDKRFRIEGHTDSTGDDLHNRRLSEARAAAVKSALLAAGVDERRIAVAGFGADLPLEGYAKTDPINRRVEAVEVR